MKQSRPRESSRRTNQFRSPRTLLTFAFAALLLGCLSIANLYSRQVGAQDLRARFQQDLGQVFSAHEEISLDPRTIAQQVRASGRISLVTPAHDFELQLQPNDLRAPNNSCRARPPASRPPSFRRSRWLRSRPTPISNTQMRSAIRPRRTATS